jgi:hypothetical protein
LRRRRDLRQEVPAIGEGSFSPLEWLPLRIPPQSHLLRGSWYPEAHPLNRLPEARD